MYDALGRAVLARSFTIEPSDGTCAGGAERHSSFAIPLDCRALSSGVYLVRFEADGFEATRKLVVE